MAISAEMQIGWKHANSHEGFPAELLRWRLQRKQAVFALLFYRPSMITVGAREPGRCQNLACTLILCLRWRLQGEPSAHFTLDALDSLGTSDLADSELCR